MKEREDPQANQDPDQDGRQRVEKHKRLKGFRRVAKPRNAAGDIDRRGVWRDTALVAEEEQKRAYGGDGHDPHAAQREIGDGPDCGGRGR